MSQPTRVLVALGMLAAALWLGRNEVAAQTSGTPCSSLCTRFFEACMTLNKNGFVACRAMHACTAQSAAVLGSPCARCYDMFGYHLDHICNLDLISCVSKCK